MSRNWLVTDLDGTLLKGDIEIAFVKHLHTNRLMAASAYVVAVCALPLSLLCRVAERGSPLKSWSTGNNECALTELALDFVATHRDQFILREELIERLKVHPGPRMVLTAAWEPLAKELVRQLDLPVDKVVGSVFRRPPVAVTPRGSDKLRFLPKDPIDVALGNEWADRHFLSRSRNPVVVGEDRRLRRLGMSKSWEWMP